MDLQKYLAKDYRHIKEDVKLEPGFFAEKTNGHFVIGRTCTLCKFSVVKQKERRPGRGWGMREGNILRGQMIAHIKAEHMHLLDAENTARGY